MPSFRLYISCNQDKKLKSVFQKKYITSKSLKRDRMFPICDVCVASILSAIAVIIIQPAN